VPRFSPAAEAALDGIVAGFDVAAAARVKEIEGRTNHDVKAVEYFLKEAFEGASLLGLRRGSPPTEGLQRGLTRIWLAGWGLSQLARCLLSSHPSP
jgi:hypothetical protein